MHLLPILSDIIWISGGAIGAILLIILLIFVLRKM
ncbi:MAG TPA: GlyGly-CTERM sorting domain-containing protein [Tepidisphaeraceae bacterium]|jgi:hypothetical protein